MFRPLATKRTFFRVEGRDWLTRRMCTVRDYEFMLQVFEVTRGGCPRGGGVLRGKKDRDDRRKSWKTTLKNTKLWNLRTLKYTSSSKINLKNTNKPEFIKEAHSKDLFYTLTNTIFIFLKDFAWTTPKNTKSPITIPNIYDDYPHHPNIGSIPPRGRLLLVEKLKEL